MKQTAHIFKSLSEEVRLRILLLLYEQGELCVCDLTAALELPQSTVSRHLAYLKHAGWLQDRRGGIWMYYSLVDQLDAQRRSLLALTADACRNLPEVVQDRLRLQQCVADREKGCI